MKWELAEGDDAGATYLSSPRKEIGISAIGSNSSVGLSAAAESRREMPLIQTIQQAVLQTIKRNGGRAFNMAEIVEIKKLCDRLLPSDLGLDVPRPVPVDQLPRFRPIRYIEVYEDADISMGIFVMPPGTTIPLHNHPQMTVISRVLYGSMQVNAFDLVAPDVDEAFWRRKEERIRNAELKHNRFPRFRPRHLKVAVQRSTEVVHGPTTTELLPDRCNIHEFITVGDIGCAVFDILTPGYNPLAGRDCTYYRALVQVEGGTAEEPWHVLEPSSLPPSSFVSVDIPYRGPAVARSAADGGDVESRGASTATQ